MAAPTQAGLITIDFDALPSGSFTTGSEDGFDLTGTGPSLISPLASLVGPPFSNPNFFTWDSSASVLTLVESDSSAFKFIGIDGATATLGTTGPLTVRGYQGATLVGTDTFTASHSPLSFSAIVLNGLALTKIEIQGDLQAGIGLSVYADNVRLETDATLVPAPTAALLLIPGLLAMARRRRSAA